MLKEIMDFSFLGNQVLDYFVCLLIFAVGFLCLVVFKSIIRRTLKKWTDKTATDVDDFLLETFMKTVVPILYFCITYASISYLDLSAGLRKTIYIIGVSLSTIYGIKLVTCLIEFFIKNHIVKKQIDLDKENRYRGLLPAIKVIVWLLGIIFLLDNLGFEISTVIAGLGIGGVAVALASQAILKDLFSYFSIMFDKPFEYGDFIIVGDFMGAIEHIGIKTTRIRSLSGEQLVFSNADLTDSRVRNYKRMGKRRVAFKLGVTYQTELKILKEIPGVIEKIITNTEDTVFDRAHFFSYGDFSLVFEVVYYVLSRDYNKYMDVQQLINFAVREEFDKRNIDFAYPTQTLFINKD